MYSRSTYRVPEQYSGVAFSKAADRAREQKETSPSPQPENESLPGIFQDDQRSFPASSDNLLSAFSGDDLLLAAMLFLLVSGKKKEGDGSVLLLLALLFFM